MEDNNTQKTKTELILAGICPSEHNVEDRVCRGCYEELLRKYNKLKNSGEKQKSPWATW